MIFRLFIVFLSLITSGFSRPNLFNELNIQRSPETVEKFESFLEKNPSLAKTMRYGVEGINGVLMASGVKGLLTSGLPKALVALGFGEALSTASSWAGGKVEGMVAEVATSESEAQRFMKALKTCAGTAGVVVGVKIATKSLKASKIQPPTIKDALSERPIIKNGKVWLGETELGSANRNAMIVRNRRLGKEFERVIQEVTKESEKVSHQIAFKNTTRCPLGTADSSVIDTLAQNGNDIVAIEVKCPIRPTRRNLMRMADRTGKQVKKAKINLPEGIRQEVWIDNRTQGIDGDMQELVKRSICEKSEGAVLMKDIRFFGEE